MRGVCRYQFYDFERTDTQPPNVSRPRNAASRAVSRLFIGSIASVEAEAEQHGSAVNDHADGHSWKRPR